MEMSYPITPEETMFFDLPKADGLRIKGILRGGLDQPVAVMLHGRPGNGNELLQYSGARFLAAHGIATLRLSLYDFEPQTRDLMDCTLETHADDFTVVTQALREKGVPRIFGIGHSYGGLTILRSQVELDAAVLWDPSHGLWWQENKGDSTKYPEKRVGEYIIGTAGCMWAYPATAKEYDEKLGDTSAWARKPYPLQVISAGNGKLADLGERYYQVAAEPKSHVVIPGAGHGFEESDEVLRQLLTETYHWLAKYTQL